MDKISETTKKQGVRAGSSLAARYTLESVGLTVVLSGIAMLVTLIIQIANHVTDHPHGILGYVTCAFVIFRMDFLGILLLWGFCTSIAWACYKRYRQRDTLEKIIGYALSLIGIIGGGLFLPYAFTALKDLQTPLRITTGGVLLSIGIFLGLGTSIRLIIIRIRKEPRWENPMSV